MAGKLKGATISINGHTDGVGGDAFNKRLSERRAGRLKIKAGPAASENRRVEVVNLAPQARARR
jgi:flagellar motor protein MotB